MRFLTLLLLIAITLSGASVYAQEEVTPEPTPTPSNDPVGAILNVGYWVFIKNEGSDITAKFIPLDTSIYAQYGILNTNILTTVPGSPGETFAHLYESASNLYQASPLNIHTSAEYMDALKSYGTGLPLELKLDLLRRVGSDMSRLYDKKINNPLVWYSPASWFQNIKDGKEDRSDDEIFNRLRTNNGSVGICRHIHRYLRDMAASMGLEAYSVSVDWRQNGSSGAHVISAFRDQVSGKIFIQNYMDIIQIGQTEEFSSRPIQEAVSQILSGSTATSVVDPAGGMPNHLYLTDTGKLMMLGIDKASGLVVQPDQDIVISVEQQTSYTGAFVKIPLNERRNRDANNQDYLFFGGQNLQNHPTLPYFRQGFIGYGVQEHYEFKPFHKQNTRWMKTVDNAGSMGFQSTYRPQTYLEGAKSQELNQAETFLFLNASTNRTYSIRSLNEKNTFKMGLQTEFKWNDFIGLTGNPDGSHSSLPYNYLKPYAALSRKLSKQTGLSFLVSEVSQFNMTNLSSSALGIRHQFYTGEVELFSVGKYGYIKVNDKLYVLPKGGFSYRSNLEFMQSLFHGKKATVSVVGSGSYGTNLRDSRDTWYSLKTYETGRIGIDYKRPFKSGRGALQVGTGMQYQGNTSTNSFDPIEMKNVQQFIDNPTGSSGWFYIRLTNIR